MYIINKYQLINRDSDLYLCNFGKGAKIANKALGDILKQLQSYEKLEIAEEQLQALAMKYEVSLEQLKTILITKLDVLKPLQAHKFPLIEINSDDPIVTDLLQSTLNTHYQVRVLPTTCYDFSNNALVVFYRNNYTSDDFKKAYHHLKEDTYLVTAGVLHKLLLIDNVYVKDFGLPSHFSNLNQLLAYLRSDIPSTKNNWLLFYRELVKNQVDCLPEPEINACQRGYVAYCVNQFLSQFTDLWKSITPMDQINWMWQADLTNFSVHTEVAVHSPLSEFDMQLNLANMGHEELV